jgi:DNA-binding NtrC family response regulator
METSPFRATVLIVDDEEDVRNGIGHTLWKSDYRLCFAGGSAAALRTLEEEQVDIVLTDYAMPGMSGLEFLKLVRDRHPDTIRIVLSGHADMTTALDAINHGEIYRFLLKPCDRDELLVTLHLACERLELERENRYLLSLIRSRPDLVQQLEEEEVRRRASVRAVTALPPPEKQGSAHG